MLALYRGSVAAGPEIREHVGAFFKQRLSRGIKRVQMFAFHINCADHMIASIVQNRDNYLRSCAIECG
jgi:hypothetical protein